MEAPVKILAIDGNSILNRAFYGVGPLNAPDGTPTNALYGFINIITKILNEEQPDGLCVMQDLRAPTFRHLQYDQYKAGRRAMPEELAAQIPLLNEYLDICRIPRFSLEGFEADDLLGTLGRHCAQNGQECLIVTGDKDSFQLVSSGVNILYVSSRMGKTETKHMDLDAISERYGLTPDQLIDLKALMGDASDNIPGVPGVGEKTALDLMHRFGSLDKLYEAFETAGLKPGVLKRLTEGRESAYMSRDLARINVSVPLEMNLDTIRRQAPDDAALRAFFERLAFKKLLQRLPEVVGIVGEGIHMPEKVSFTFPNVEIVDSPEKLAVLTTALGSASQVAFSMQSDMIGLCCDGKAFSLVCSFAPAELAAFWVSPTPKVGHRVKETIRELLPLEPVNLVMDTALAAYLLNPAHGQYLLEALTLEELGGTLEPPGQEALFGMVSQEELLSVGRQAAAIEALGTLYKERLHADGATLDTVLKDIELPLSYTLARMEAYGFRLDTQALTVFGGKLSLQIDALSQAIYEQAGRTFNISSPKQLGDILFNQLQLPTSKKTKTGYSVDAEVLERLKHHHPIIEPLLTYRELTKLKSTYVDGLLNVCGADGRVRTTFQMTGTATGRLSSSEPNLQNIPIRRSLGAELRRMFIPSHPDWVLVDADYSQIELRVLAHIAKDQHMQDAFRQGEDIHTVTASQVFHVPLEDVTPTMRRDAKAVNFGIVFGISEFSLAGDIGVSRAEAKLYIEHYLHNFSGVKQYMEQVVVQAKENGFVTTLLGRRRYLPELKASNHNTRAFGERAALNTPIQGTAADIIKLAMIALDKRLRAEGLKAKLILQIHDELIVECPPEEAEAVKNLVKYEMEHVFPLDPSLVADAGIGENWLAAK